MPAFANSTEFILEDEKNGERTKPESLNLFETFAYDQGSLTFVGGPVHAAAWAPVPLRAPSVMQVGDGGVRVIGPSDLVVKNQIVLGRFQSPLNFQVEVQFCALLFEKMLNGKVKTIVVPSETDIDLLYIPRRSTSPSGVRLT